MALDLNKFITQVRSMSNTIPGMDKVALMFQQIQDGVNQGLSAAGVDATGFVSPPDPPSAMSVKANSGVVHATLQDNSTRARPLNYFVEAATEPAFLQPHVFHLGASRGTFITLPAMNDAGVAQPWYFRSYSMYQGSTQPSAHQVYGGTSNPTAVNVGGTTALTPLPSTGSGTSSTTGQQGGTGFGVAQVSTPHD